MREREREWFMGLRGERGRELVFKIFEDEETKGKTEKFDREYFEWIFFVETGLWS